MNERKGKGIDWSKLDNLYDVNSRTNSFDRAINTPVKPYLSTIVYEADEDIQKEPIGIVDVRILSEEAPYKDMLMTMAEIKFVAINTYAGECAYKNWLPGKARIHDGGKVLAYYHQKFIFRAKK